MAPARAERLDLNHPPTSVGGIHRFHESCRCRLDLNHPPTAVGGIFLTPCKRKTQPVTTSWVASSNMTRLPVCKAAIVMQIATE